jgi:hypothetical protein
LNPHTHPRERILSKAEVLGVTVEDLLWIRSVGKRERLKVTAGPRGKVREVFDRVSKLPRRQQEHIVNWVSAYVSQYQQTRQS